MSTWLNDGQRAFLVDKYPQFVEAQNTKQTHRFWAPVYEVWWSRWPIDDSLIDDLTPENRKAVVARMQKGKEKVRQSHL